MKKPAILSKSILVSCLLLININSATADILVNKNTQWKYSDTGSNLGSQWVNNNFNDSTWNQGNGYLGYGGFEQTTVSYGANPYSKYITTYFRRKFNVTNVSGLSELKLRLMRDDGAIVYINGTSST